MQQITVSILKADSFGRVELVERNGERLLRRVACGGAWPGSAVIARRLLRREQAALAQLEGLEGFPQAPGTGEWDWARIADDATLPSDAVGLREFIDGFPLSAAPHLASNFFDRLEELVGRMHERGVCHNDLHKEQNILVSASGFPCLIDFQLASLHAKRGRGFRVRCHEDQRHIQKHRRRYLRDGRGPQGSAPPTDRMPRKPLSKVWRKTGKPLYNWVTRRLLNYSDGEARRPSSGPWPEWGEALPPWTHEIRR